MRKQVVINVLISIGILTTSMVLFAPTQLGLLYGIGFIVTVCIAYYVYLREQLHNASFINLGFTPVKTPADILQKYYIGQNEMSHITKVFQSTKVDYPFTIVRFNIIRGLGKYKHTYSFIGFEFTTTEVHPSVQIRQPYGTVNPPQTIKRKLESTEFHKLYSVYAEDPKAPFFFLDPDTMADMIDYQKELGFAINIDVSGNNILIFIAAGDGKKLFTQKLSFMEILKGRASQQKQTAVIAGAQKLFNVALKMFALLDYKLQR